MAAADVEAVDFEPEEDDLMDEDAEIDADTSPRAAAVPRLRSAVTSTAAAAASVKTKGRGFRQETDTERNSRLTASDFDSLNSDGGPGPARSIEGWIVLITGVHEEAQEEDLHNVFGEFGQLKSLHLNLDRRTGFVKGYALIEYEHFEEAQEAINKLNGTIMLDHTINVDWAFCNGPYKRKGNRRRSPRGRRSRSPQRRF